MSDRSAVVQREFLILQRADRVSLNDTMPWMMRHPGGLKYLCQDRDLTGNLCLLGAEGWEISAATDKRIYLSRHLKATTSRCSEEGAE